MDPTSIKEAEDASGCRFEIDSNGGYHRVDCPDFDSKVRLLDQLAWQDAYYDPTVRRVAMQIAGTCRTREPEELSPAIHRFVRDNVPYLGEGMETFSNAADTLRYGGDCDDSVRLCLALARALGIKTRLFARPPSQAGVQGHCCAELWDGSSFRWAEASIPAHFGEVPEAALVRLRRAGVVRARARSDIGSIGEMGAIADDVSSAEVLTNPNALYAAAYKAADIPSITNTLGPIAKPYLDAGLKAIEHIATDELNDLVSVVEGELAADISPELAQALSSVVSEAAAGISAIADEIPAIGTIISLIALVVQNNGPSLADIANYAAEAKAALDEPVQGTGPGDVVTPADIFTPDPQQTGGFYSGFNWPRSSLGRFLVAITEADEHYPITSDSATNLENLEPDAPLRHTGAAYHVLASRVAAGTDLPTGTVQVVAGELGAGIPVETRKVLAALRLAMASQNIDKGAAVWPIYLKILSNLRKSGQLTRSLATALPSFYWRAPTIYGAYGAPFGFVTDEPHGSNPEGDGSPGPYAGPGAWAPYADQLWQILDAWDAKEAATPINNNPPIKLSGNALKLSGTVGKTLAVSADSQARRQIVQAWSTVAGAPEPTLTALQAFQSICRFETGYGHWTGPGAGSNNMGANQCARSDASGQCPPGSFANQDSHANGTKYVGCFCTYATPVAGFAAVLRILVGMKVAQYLDSGDARLIASRMRAAGYFEAPASKYAAGIASTANSIAKALSEPQRVTLSSAAAPILGVLLGVVGVGGGLWWQRRRRSAARR